jgi:hypothetical protein
MPDLETRIKKQKITTLQYRASCTSRCFPSRYTKNTFLLQITAARASPQVAWLNHRAGSRRSNLADVSARLTSGRVSFFPPSHHGFRKTRIHAAPTRRVQRSVTIALGPRWSICFARSCVTNAKGTMHIVSLAQHLLHLPMSRLHVHGFV